MLNEDVQEKIESKEYENIQDFVYHVVRSEQRILRCQAHGGRTTNTSSWRHSNQQEEGIRMNSKLNTSSKSIGAIQKETSNAVSAVGKDASMVDSSAFCIARTSNIELQVQGERAYDEGFLKSVEGSHYSRWICCGKFYK